ncbi:MAG: starch-binding protein, partial [Treponema sp.]|nr:starch-binding protein [Treponema sp.]
DIPAINNLNNNNAQGNANKILTSSNYEDYAYNRQPNGINNNVLTDDLELDVWQFKEAARAKNGSILQPHMKVGPAGQLGFSYANATLYFNMPGEASDENIYGQTPFGRNFGGFTQNAFTYDSSGTAYGVALCPDTSGQAGMSANLQFFSGKSGLDGKEGGGDLNNNYYNQGYARRIENTSLKLDGSSITQNINRIQSPSMTTYTDGSNKYVYVAYYDELSRQVRFRVGSIGSSRNVIGMGLVDLVGATGRVSGKDDEPKLNRNTTRDSISGYRVETITVSSVTNDVYVLVPQNYGYRYIHAWNGYDTEVAYPGVEMPLVNGYYIYKMPDTSSTKLILNNGGAGDSNKAGGGDLQISSSGVYSWNGSRLQKLTSGTIKYQSSSSTMPTYEGYQYCHVVAASGVSNGTAEYNSATSKKAGQYVSVGALSDGTAVMAWYDSGAGRLAFSYNSEPLTAKTTLQAGTDTWQHNSYYVSDSSIRAGTHVSMAVDASNGIHLAYYSASGGDLYYSYIKNPKAQSKPTKTVMVDSYGSVGTYTMIDVARDSETSQFIPYISFRCESNADTTASVKIAYPVKWSGEGNVLSGVDEYDRYTGNWEVSVIPTDNTPLTDYTNIGLNKNWSTGVRKIFSKASDVSKSWTATFAVGDSTTVYGNGTDNPILSYAVSENGVLEMAQKK